MSSFEVSREGENILLCRSEGPFGVPVSQWELTIKEAELIIKFLGNAVTSMKKRRADSAGVDHG